MEKNTLKKSVTVVEAMAIVVGMVIGSDIFLKPGIVLGNAGSSAMSITVQIANGTITLASALSAAGIASTISKSGGLYTYLEELYDERAGFLLGWVQAVVSYPASIAAQAIAFLIYTAYFIPVDGIQQKLLATDVLIFILVMSILSTKCGSIIQILTTVSKLIPIVAIIGVGLLSPGLPGFTGSSQGALQGVGFGTVILDTLQVYDGWIGVTNMVGELGNPPKTLLKVISIGVLFVIVIYALFNLTIFRTLPLDQIVASATPGAGAANVLFGKDGATFITTGIVISVFGALSDYLMTTACVPQAMGERGQLPFFKILGAVHPELYTPANALTFQSLLVPVYIFSGTFNTLTDLLVFVLWTFFTVDVLGAFIPRKRRHPEEGKYRVPLYPIIPIIGAVGGVYILISTLIDAPFRSVIGLTITLLGPPVYQWMKKKKEQ